MTMIKTQHMNARFARAAATEGANAPKGEKGLKREGNVIKTERYDITITKDKVRIFDKETNTWTEVWGDPHITTGDGDTTDFHDGNVTFDLKDGTKVTIAPTEKVNGKAYIDKVFITNGDQGTVIENVHGTGDIEFGKIGRNSKLVDELADDGTVLTAGEEVDDLFLPDASELIGDLLKSIDGLGGKSSISHEDAYSKEEGNTSVSGASSSSRANFGANADLAKINSKLEALRNKKDKTPDDYSEIQDLQNEKMMLYSFISNSQKTEHETYMAIIRNL